MIAPSVLEGLEAEALDLDAQVPGAEPVPAVEGAGEQSGDAPIAPSGEVIKAFLPIIADQLAPNWQLSVKEMDDFSDKLGAVLDKYVGGGVLGLMDRWKEEIALAMVCVTIYKTRVGVPLVAPPPKDDAVDGQASQA